MFRCSWSTALIGLLICSQVAAADAVILRDDGYYVLRDNSLTAAKAVVVDQRTGAVDPVPDPQPNPVPDPQPDPAPTGARAESERLAKEVNNKKEAVFVGAVYNTFHRELFAGRMTVKQARDRIAMFRNLAFDASLTPGVATRWKPFATRMDEILTAAADTEVVEYFGDVRDGLAAAAGVDPRVFNTVQSVVKLHSDHEDAVEAAHNALDDGEAPQEFLEWLPQLLQFVQQILQFLRDLGILK